MYQGGSIHGCQGKDISARDDAWTRVLYCGLDFVDQIKTTQTLVGNCTHLRFIRGRAVDENGCITPLHMLTHETVMLKSSGQALDYWI